MEKVKLYMVLGIFALVIAATVAAILTVGRDNGTDAVIDSVANTDRSASNTSDQTSSQQVSVDIKNQAYTPGTIKVKVGTTVTWTNQDSMEHNVAPDNPSSDFKAGDLLKRGESYSVTFNNPGIYTYHCTPHPFMKGTVEVVDQPPSL